MGFSKRGVKKKVSDKIGHHGLGFSNSAAVLTMVLIRESSPSESHFIIRMNSWIKNIPKRFSIFLSDGTFY